MRHGSSNRRTRNRGGNGGRQKAPNKNRVYDSSGPEVRIRGTAHQITEKYMVLAKDAASSGDHILAQSYMQHAEHYQRIINEWAEQQPQREATPVASDKDESVEEVAVEVKAAQGSSQSSSETEAVLEDA